MKFYTTPQHLPLEVSGYRDPYGLRPAISLEQELDEMAASFGQAQGPMRSAALSVINNVRDRAYPEFSDFRRDLTAYLEEVRIRNRSLPNLAQARRAWSEALQLLRAEYWQRRGDRRGPGRGPGNAIFLTQRLTWLYSVTFPDYPMVGLQSENSEEN